MKYPYYIAMAVPDASREAANQAVADTTGRSADTDTFQIKYTGADDTIWWVASMPVQAKNYARFPDLQAAIGGGYTMLREVVDGELVRHQTLQEWTDSLSLVRGEPDALTP